MGKLTFGMMASLDGFINDSKGGFEWGQINPAVHRFAEQEQARAGTSIYGRRMFETMAVWDTLADDPDVSDVERDFAKVWRDSDKIVVSRALQTVSTGRTRLVRALSAQDIDALKAASPKDINVSGPTLAAHFLAQGLIDEITVYTIPVLVGGGTPMFQQVGGLLQLERVELQAFDNGVTFARYAVRR